MLCTEIFTRWKPCIVDKKKARGAPAQKGMTMLVFFSNTQETHVITLWPKPGCVRMAIS